LKPETVISNYPRAADLPSISPAQAKATLALLTALDRMVSTSLVALFGTAFTVSFCTLNFGVWLGVVLLVVCLYLWTLYCSDVKLQLCTYAALAGWASTRTHVACAIVYLCITLLPGIIGLPIVNNWICQDLKRLGIRCRAGYVPREMLKMCAAASDPSEKEIFSA
jgi:hypothetical protein